MFGSFLDLVQRRWLVTTPRRSPDKPSAISAMFWGSRKVSDTFWPSLKKKLEEDPDNFGRLNISCRICRKSTTIGGQPYHGPSPTRDHRASILPCGHIFGDKCIDEHFKIRGNRKCPTCKVKLQHATCPHPCLGVPVPHCQTLISTVLPTLSEGGQIAEDCCLCDMAEAASSLVNEAIAAYELPPNHFVCASFQFPVGHLVCLSMVPFYLPTNFVPEIEGPLKKIEALQEHRIELERQLQQKHLHAWSTGDLAGLDMELHIYECSIDYRSIPGGIASLSQRPQRE